MANLIFDEFNDGTTGNQWIWLAGVKGDPGGDDATHGEVWDPDYATESDNDHWIYNGGSALWPGDYDPSWLYQEDISGDFDFYVKVSYNAVNNFEHAGILVELDNQNYFRVSLKSFSGFVIESASVVSNNGYLTRPSYNDSEVLLRLRRIGSTMDAFYAPSAGEPWTLVNPSTRLTTSAAVKIGIYQTTAGETEKTAYFDYFRSTEGYGLTYDEFNDGVTGLHWTWEQGTTGAHREQDGYHEIDSGTAEMEGKSTFDPDWIFQEVEGNFDVHTRISVPDKSGDYRRAGLCITSDFAYPDNDNYVWVGVRDNDISTVCTVDGNDYLQNSGEGDSGAQDVLTRIRRNGDTIDAYYRYPSDTTWTTLNASTMLSTNDRIRIGLFASHWSDTQFTSKFDYFRETIGPPDATLSGSYYFLVDSDYIDSDLTWFPVAITMGTYIDGSEFFSNDNDTDIKYWFEDEFGTRLYSEIESIDMTNQVATFHVAVPSASSTTDTEIIFYWNFAGSDKSQWTGITGSITAQEVWDDNFKGVWHMSQSPTGGTDCMLDSTQYLNHGTPGGSMTHGDLVDSYIGKGIEFDGSDDEVDCEIDSSLQDMRTLEAYLESYGHSYTWNSVVGRETGGSGYAMLINSTDDKLYYYQQGFSSDNIKSDGTFSENNPHYLAMGYKAGEYRFVQIDTAETSGSYSGSANNNSGDRFWIAQSFFAPREWNGLIDEVRMSDVFRTRAWRKATYYNLTNSLIISTAAPEPPVTEWTLTIQDLTSLTSADNITLASLLYSLIVQSMSVNTSLDNVDLSFVMQYLLSIDDMTIETILRQMNFWPPLKTINNTVEFRTLLRTLISRTPDRTVDSKTLKRTLKQIKNLRHFQ